MASRHKHCELIKAWAEGAEIQCQSATGWLDVREPVWDRGLEYRIKPRRMKHEGWVVVCEYSDSTRWVGATIFRSREEAAANRPGSHIAIAKIEWEEEILNGAQ